MESSPSSSTISRTFVLILRVLTFVFLLTALIINAVNKQTVETDNGDAAKLKFNDIYSYRYMLATIVIGFAYNLLQMALSIFNMVSGKRVISGDGGYLFDFFGDKIISYTLATGAAAGFGSSQDVHRVFKDLVGVPFNHFFVMANASASLLLIAFLFTAIASIFSSYALPKKA